MKLCGCNNFNQLDVQSNNRDSAGRPIISPPKDLQDDFSSNIVSYSTFYCHSIAINIDGDVIAIGDNTEGQISKTIKKKRYNEFTIFPIKDNKGNQYHSISAVCGESYSLYLTSKDKISKQYKLAYSHKNLNSKTPLFLNLTDFNPVSLYGGAINSAAIDENGTIIFIPESIVTSPNSYEFVRLPEGEKAISIACCDKFIVVVSSTFSTYFSEINKRPNFINLKKIKSLKKHQIIEVSGTSEHCFALSKEGRVFAFGSNREGKLGVGDNKKELNVFTEILTESRLRFKRVYAGPNHSLFQTENGRILSCGSNVYGELLNDNKKKNIWLPIETEITNNALFCVTGVGTSVVFYQNDPMKSPNRSLYIENTNEIDADRVFEIMEENKRLKIEIKRLTEINHELNDQNVGLQNDNDNLKEQNDQLKLRITKIRGDKSNLIYEKEQLNQRVAKLNNEKSDLIEENNQLKQKLVKTEKENKQMKNDFNLEKERLQNEIYNLERRVTDLEKENSIIVEQSNKYKDRINIYKIRDEKFSNENNRLKNELAFKNKVIESKSGETSLFPLYSTHLNFLNQKTLNDEIKIEGEIGNGGQSTVYLVTYQKKFALKKMRIYGRLDDSSITSIIDKTNNKDQFKRLFKEHEILLTLKHPNIIPTYGISTGDESNPPSILLQYCPSNLKKYINKMDSASRICAICEIASAMDAVHKANLIHRDLKPENILIDFDGHVKICDFGIAAIITDDTTSLTSEVGTFGYMAPEIVKNHYDNKVDVFSFGVVVYFILTGKKPKNIYGKISFPSNINVLSRQLINRCLSENAEERPSFSTILEKIKKYYFKLIDVIEKDIGRIKEFLSLDS